MHPHRIVPFLSLALASGGTLAAQATSDQARLVFSVNAGYIPGASGWRVIGQPLYDDQFPDPALIDSLTITRQIRPER